MRVTVYNSTIQVVFPNKEMIVEGSVGLTFDLLCTKEWESYNKTVVFKRTDSQDQTYEVLVGLPLESTVTIPWEILTEAGAFQVGIYGTKDAKVLPTIWCSPIRIEKGTPTSNNGSPEEPTPTVYAQILDELESKCTQKTGEDLYNKTQVMVGEIYQCSEDFEDLFITGYFYQYQANGTYTRINVQPPMAGLVTSVNSQVGDVNLTANDVDAYSKSETDTKLSEKQNVIDSNNKLPYALISGTPTIPTKTSDLTNDSGYITNAVNNLINYYLKSETYNKTEINSLISQIQTSHFETVAVLPTVGERNVIYLLPRQITETGNIYDEYIYISNAYEKIGSTDVDLTGYATETWVNTQIAGFLTQSQIEGLISTALENYYTKTEVDTALGNKENTSNKVTSLSAQSTDTQYPSAKCVYDGLANKVDKEAGKGLFSGSYTDLIDKPTIPTKTSDLTNDSGFITNAVDDLTNYYTKSELSTVATTGSYNDLTNKPTIPTKTSDLTNDSGFIENTVDDLTNYYDKTEVDTELANKVDKEAGKGLFSGSYTDLIDKPTIPTQTSDLTNDSGFITNTVDDLINYYLKSETYTKTEVNNLISAISTMSLQVVQALPTEDIQTNVIYLVPRVDSETGNIYDEYIYVSNAWEKIGSTDIDLTGYATETWVNTQISGFLTQVQIEGLISTALGNYYTKSEVDTALGNKVDKEAGKGLFSGSYTDLTNKPTIPTVDQTYDSTSANAQSGVAVAGAISGKEDTSNKVTSLSAQSTDTQYPSAKCVYDIVGDIESLLSALR